MKIGVTVRFQNSYFSGGLPQTACAIARTLSLASHDVTLLYPKGEQSWFMDIQSFTKDVAKRVEWASDQQYDIILEIVWSLASEDRARCAKKVIGFSHYPPVFYDMESCVYPWNQKVRDFKNLTAVWTYDFYSAQDVRYLEFLSGVKVVQVPYVWDPDALDAFLKENNVPTWNTSAKRIESALPPTSPKTLSWCARVMESNFSNGSHCVIPLNIISQIRLQNTPIRFCVHNGEHTGKNEFFNTNIARNLLLPDISGNMVPRVRLPDLLAEKTFLVAHQRFRPLKSYLLDAMYLGIPMIHNCEMIRTLGAPYYYELNQILEATRIWTTMNNDYESSTGFFNPSASATRQTALRSRFSPSALSAKFSTIVTTPIPSIQKPLKPSQLQSNELRIAFADMWDDFQPNHNFFMYLLSWVGHMNNICVVHDDVHPNIVFFGPLSKGAEKKYPGIPKVFYTGENSPPNKDKDTFLNLGYMYDTNPSYIRLPLWVLEINWWNADPEKIVNPKPVPLEDALRVNPDILKNKSKFCAFVATNPTNQNRNASFQILDKWKGVDSGGRLFCNLPNGPIPAGRGGGGGELVKVDFYKSYKFVISYENSSSPGYTTEKLFHAKLAGAVPIYWGDPFVDRDFDSGGYINANQVSSAEKLIELIQNVDSNNDVWQKMASVPALSELKKLWCQRTMGAIAKKIYQSILDKSVKIEDDDWSNANTFGKLHETQPKPRTSELQSKAQSLPPIQQVISSPKNRVFVTAVSAKYVEAGANILASLRHHEPITPKIVYVWPDVTEKYIAVLQQYGATEIRNLPVTVGSETPWADFWEPQHYSWKLWILSNMMDEAPSNSSVVYINATTIVACSIESVWSQIESTGVFFAEDEQVNARWCHPVSCASLNLTQEELEGKQIWSGCVGFKKGSPYADIAKQALEIAKTKREALVGEKWKPYSTTCLGHRNDKSILSVLSQRAKAPRMPLKGIYCDKSMRAAQQLNIPLYAHRGHFKHIIPFAVGIDEAYVINLERRKDRMERFTSAHPSIQDRVYRWKATDGMTLQLTPEIIHLFRKNDFAWKKAIMGCALSHLGLWEKLAQDSLANSYLILEDDVKFNDRWLLQWAKASQHVPSDADVIYLGGVLPPNKPVLPTITEPVNTFFAKVARNNMYGGPLRRYFHFCNYSYVLTKKGATKLVNIVKEQGIFTSGDHMIVNHGDELLNIYFTTPLLSTCFQEDDPVYQKSEFNNFSRIDNFDSDLWNNDKRFTKEDIEACLKEPKEPKEPKAPQEIVIAKPEKSEKSEKSEKPEKLVKPVSKSKEEHIKVWNTFLRNISQKDTKALKTTLTDIFSIWETFSSAMFQENVAWFRIFEQFVLTKNSTLLELGDYTLSLIQSSIAQEQLGVWSKVIGALAKNPYKNVYHSPQIDVKTLLEIQWINYLFQTTLTYAPYGSIDDILNDPNPIVFYQIIHGKDASIELQAIVNRFAEAKKQFTLLHLSDEFGADNIQLYSSPAIKKVLRNYWRPDMKQYGDKVICFPLGYTNDRQSVDTTTPTFLERNNLWAFAGSKDRKGREEALTLLRSLTPYEEHTKATWSTPALLDGPAYRTMMRNAKFVPCFCGSRSLESYRVYEALENGAIPIYIPSEQPSTGDEFRELYGKHPFLGFPSWAKAVELLPTLATKTDAMEKHRQQLQEWWAKRKELLRTQLML